MIDAATIDPLPDEPDPDHGFWSQTDELSHIHSFARARRVSPYATLGCVLRRAAASIEPHVVLPPTIGGYASVNLYTASAGVSGQGKGAADAAGSAAVYFHDDKVEDLDADRPSIGSGEGLARLFSGGGKGQTALTRAHLIVPEVKTLEALMGRQGSTLVGELLKGYIGEALGFNNAQRDTTTAIKSHSYRLCLGVGVQPENAGFFLAREKDGFPQRFLWLPTIDPYAPEERPEPVDQLDVLVPPFSPNCDDWHVVVIPDSARDEIDAHRHRVLVGDPDVDPLDGHLMLTRLKVAFALAVLHSRTAVGENEWKIARDLVDMSIRVRDQMRVAVDNARRRQNSAKAHDQAEREAIIAERLSNEAQRRVVKAVCSKLRRVGRATRKDLRVACAAVIRGEFDAVFEMLVDQQIIAKLELTGERFTPEYEFGPEYHKGVS
jgi:hypothetical protein